MTLTDSRAAAALPGLTPRHGKVRDVYDFADRLLLVATDRISAFDWILPTLIPDKGRVLTQLSAFWFERLSQAGIPHHLLSLDPTVLPLPPGSDLDYLRGRSMVVTRSQVVPFECVVRGYLAGSGWKEYRQQQSVCGVPLPAGLLESSRLPQPIFTPATKAETGHDENVSYNVMCTQLQNAHLAEQLRDTSLKIYGLGAAHAAAQGILLADTKFEFGQKNGQLLLIDEVLTPDSSRFWPAAHYAPGSAPPSFDKQFVRNWLEQTGWDKNSPPPALPHEVVTQTRTRYLEAFERLAGRPLSW